MVKGFWTQTWGGERVNRGNTGKKVHAEALQEEDARCLQDFGEHCDSQQVEGRRVDSGRGDRCGEVLHILQGLVKTSDVSPSDDVIWKIWGGEWHKVAHSKSCSSVTMLRKDCRRSKIEAERTIGRLLQNDTQDEWIYKLWYLHTMKYYLAIKRHDTCYNVAWTSKLLCKI